MFQIFDEKIHIETAFLYGDLDEEIYMKIPEGYIEYLEMLGLEGYLYDEHCCKLNKAIYGLVQAARQWWKKFKQAMKKIGFEVSPVDPCLFIRKEKDSEIPSMLFIYIDDGGIVASKEVIEETIEALGKEFKIKILGPMHEMIGCTLTISEDGKTLWITQPKLIKHMKELFLY